MIFGKNNFVDYDKAVEKEWMQTNGINGFCGSTMIGANRRKYQALLTAGLSSPEIRYTVLSSLHETVEVNGEEFLIASRKHKDEIVDGFKNQVSFYYDGLPHYKYLVNGSIIEKKVVMQNMKNTVVVEYNVINNDQDLVLNVSPLMTFREPGICSGEENLEFTIDVKKNGFELTPELNKEINIRIYMENADVKDTKSYLVEDIYYDVDKSTGDKYLDKCFVPGKLSIEVKAGETKKIYVVCTIESDENINAEEIVKVEEERMAELRSTFEEDRIIAKYLPISADHFIVDRESINGKTVLAGYPWFLDWGRDTMIALNGVTLATNRLEDAKDILKSFAQYEEKGLIPNMFPGKGNEPLYNTVDASLWYVHAVYSYLLYSNSLEELEFIKKELYPTIKNIIKYYSEGTDFSIKMDKDGLINAGSGDDQVTWMDVRAHGIVVTPRHGKPVEINALWYNALMITGFFENKFEGTENNQYFKLATKVKESFNKEFWNEKDNCLYDVVNSEGRDGSIRPNQIWAISLPFTMLDKEKEKKTVQTVMKELYTPYGLRSLSRGHEDYKGMYIGKLFDRDMAYHQGTVWGFPIGGFMTAYCKVNDYSKEAVETVDGMLRDMETHIQDQCLGGIAEIFDGDNPHNARGCYSQAWSVGEILRVYNEDILGNWKNLKEAHNRIFE